MFSLMLSFACASATLRRFVKRAIQQLEAPAPGPLTVR
jgi:hypothetical protein